MVSVRHAAVSFGIGILILCSACTSSSAMSTPPSMTISELGTARLRIQWIGGGSRDFLNRPVAERVTIGDPVRYDTWGALDFGEKFWDLGHSSLGAPAGTLRVALRVRTLPRRVEMNGEPQLFLEVVRSHALVQAESFRASVAKHGTPRVTSAPDDFRVVQISSRDWVAYDRADSQTKIYTSQLDPLHSVELVFTYIANTPSAQWTLAATEYMNRILSGVALETE